MSVSHTMTEVEQWSIFELTLPGSAEGNPFLDVAFTAQFSYQHRMVEVDGFYDGDGVYRVRFMPDMQGTWRYRTRSQTPALDGVEGTFTCIAPGPANHGPVRVARTYHFAYADGTPYTPVGTTCYAWTHQGDALEEQTLATLGASPFNKLRMGVFPKHYIYNENEPEYYPFPCLARGASQWQGNWRGEPPVGWAFDTSRFDPAFFQHLERRVADLMVLGIEADIILFHPYDRWGFATLDAATNERYLRYVVARLAAYRNVWWSLANEWDFVVTKTVADWDNYFRIIQASDPYQHLRSIHNGTVFYDHAKPWVTHQSIQSSELKLTRTWREQCRKPVVVDECCYEGNIPNHWGNISAQELVHRCWEGTAQGGYVGHGETLLHPQDILWWAKGGVLHGESAPRLAFLRRILEDSPSGGLDPVDGVIRRLGCAGHAPDYYLCYFGVHQPAHMAFLVPEGERYTGEAIDTWAMTVTPLAEPVVRGALVPLPGKPYHALILRRVAE